MDRETRHTLAVTSRQNAGVTVVKMKGSLSATTGEQGSEEMKKIVEGGAKKIVVNLADIDYISSGGIRVLLMASKWLSDKQGEMKISGAKGMVNDALQASGFGLLKRVYGSAIQLCQTDEEAIAAFKA